MTLFAFTGAVEAGLIFALVAIGVWLSFRVLDFPDLTVDGSFPLGAAVCAVSLIGGIDPFSSVVFAALAGFVAGWVTAQLHLRLNILHLLASILVMLALYSINLRIMGRPNLPLLTADTVFDPFALSWLASYATVPLVLLFVVIAIKFAMDWFLATETGLALRAAGANPQMAAAHGIDRDRILPLGLGLSNALVAMAGALFAQAQGFADVTMGVGTIIIGLAAVIIGETLLPARTIVLATLAVVLGSVVYRIVIAFALNLDAIGLRAQDLNLVTVALVVLAIAAARVRSRMRLPTSPLARGAPRRA